MHVQTGLHSSWHDVSVDASRVDVLGRALREMATIQLLLSVKLINDGRLTGSLDSRVPPAPC